VRGARSRQPRQAAITSRSGADASERTWESVQQKRSKYGAAVGHLGMLQHDGEIQTRYGSRGAQSTADGAVRECD